MQNRQIKKPSHISETTVSRRTVLDWLGKATVLALGGKYLAACTVKQYAPKEVDTSSYIDLDSGTDSEGQQKEFSFSPGKALAPLFEDFRVRTVDPQVLADIIENWKLIVDGLVEKPTVFDFGDLLSLNRHNQITDFHCVEGWSVYDVPWNGVHISAIFDRVTPKKEASYITFYSIGDVYLESIPIDTAMEPMTMLAYGINESTIPMAHGFPLRLVIPRLLGYKNAKYLYRIELTDKPLEGYWVKAGYPYDGIVPEGRLREGKY